jgi:hypothetical protein
VVFIGHPYVTPRAGHRRRDRIEVCSSTTQAGDGIRELTAESYRLLEPKKLTAQSLRSHGD